jgi:N-alpha-acetyl-L-2,4-diaminobutyrate deacetylase
VVLDIHSGGRTLEFVPFAAVHTIPDKEQHARCVAAMEAFNAPYSMVLLEIDSVGMYDTAAEEMGKVFVSTELGGGGSARAHTLAIAKRGVRNVLRHAGVLGGDIERQPSLRLEMPDRRCFVTSESTGLLELCCDLGSEVREGDVVARIHDIERTGAAVVEYGVRTDGILAGRHFPGLIAMGDTIAVIAVP